MIEFSAAAGVAFDPAYGLTDSSGQVATNVTLAYSGRYQLTGVYHRQIAKRKSR